ncbi:MAG: hypothetical protein M3418_07275 [Gemmatimonadota bacterium]|nr:hypothetical protein [Gemmatimonadota bacterium]
MLPLAPAVGHPIIHADGLVEHPGSMLVIQRQGLRRLISSRVLEPRR